MTAPDESGAQGAGSALPSRAGLRLRLWVGTLAGSLVTVAGLAWVMWNGWPDPVAFLRDPAGLRLGIIAIASFVVALAAAAWIDRGVVSRVRRLTTSTRAADSTPLLDPFSASGWGELSDLRNHVSALITRYRQAVRSADQLQLLERQLDDTRQRVQYWIETERWSRLPAAGALAELTAVLNHGITRRIEVDEQNEEAARQVEAGIADAVRIARETAEQSERGFVEVTALLTTVRELERLGAELHLALGAHAVPSVPERTPAATPVTGSMEVVTDAFRELVEAASGSVDDLAAGLGRVQELSDQVHVLGNRSTLIALNALVAVRRGEPDVAAMSADELKQLAREARVATDRVRELAADGAAQVRQARERMQAVRLLVTARLAALQLPVTTAPAAAVPAAPAFTPGTLRALDRVREMISDAARKAERLSAAGEHASRAADRLVLRLDEDLRDVQGLVVRLSPMTEPSPAERTTETTEPRRFDVIGPERRIPPIAPGGERQPGAEERP